MNRYGSYRVAPYGSDRGRLSVNKLRTIEVERRLI
nr:MAG TPA: hypothetical protein [Bacteriophage sp.]